MIKPKVLASLNKQIQQELTASNDYLSISIYFDLEVLKGFAAYFKKQSEEEREHAMKILEFVQDSNDKPEIEAIAAPKTGFSSPLEAVKHAREMERANTASIHALYSLAVKENDLPTQNMLQWFIKEQVEEEKWAEEFVIMVEKCGSSVGSLYMLDHRVSKLAKEDD